MTISTSMLPFAPLSAVFAAGLVASAHAVEPVVFDPDGDGSGAVLVQQFDWAPGNALTVGLTPLSPDAPHRQLQQAALANLFDPDSNVINVPGLNTGGFEITMLTGYGQTGTSLIPGYTILALDSAQDSFFVMYYDDTPDSDPLAGTGYDDGIPILTGIITSNNGTLSAFEPVVALDQVAPNNYPAITTLEGNGAATLSISVDTANPGWFPDALPASFIYNTYMNTPFTQTNPSAQFVDGGVLIPAVAPVNGQSGPDFQSQNDATMSPNLEEEIVGACRMTGGGVTYDGEIPLDSAGEVAVLAEAEDGKNRYTFGGQIGAPTASQPDPKGEWTHHQFKGPAGQFVFRIGTNSAPPETRVLNVFCQDEGFCNPARPAPFKQLDFIGIGSFRNVKGQLNSIVTPDNKDDFTLHCTFVHFEDIGEPGPGGKQPHSEQCTHTIGTPIDESEDCSNCADVYQIEIHATEDCGSAVIYSMGGFIDNGNIQIHPEIK